MFKNLFNRFSKDIAIDLGTSKTLMLIKDKGVVIHEASVVAVNKKTGQIIEVGREAVKMLGKTPPHILIIQPLVDGVISDFEVTEKMIKYFFDKIARDNTFFSPRPRAIIGIPLDVTEVEKKAVEDAVLFAGAREVRLVENVIAAAIGARLPIQDATGNMIVNLGAGVTEIAVISLSGVVSKRTLRIAGNELDQDIVLNTRNEHNLLIGEKIAEDIKLEYSKMIHSKEKAEYDLKIRGRDLLTGLPKEVPISCEQITKFLERSVRSIVDGVKTTLEITPPELIADIYQRGLVLVGGGSLLRGLDTIIAQNIKIPVRIIDDPITCAVRGMGIILEDEKLLHEVIVPTMRDEERS
ncbi:MAG: Cell shape determining protein, MreB/Mrl family [Parcubacteria group bacterium GW2011_GWA2_38_13]|nr:MAG: Cell shape determining protein, MreB/Mrl family [Parcubacteria group bacterium GW2011_GWA2_38_13]